MEFQHNLGVKVESKVAGVTGIITSRSENLYGCNRYYIQPKVGNDGKVPDGWWVDEDDVTVIGDGLVRKEKTAGGPMSKVC